MPSAASRPGRLRLEHDVGAADEVAEALRPSSSSRSSITPNLFDLVVPPAEAALGVGHVVDERAVVALRRAAGRLDQDDLGAVVGEQRPQNAAYSLTSSTTRSPSSGPGRSGGSGTPRWCRARPRESVVWGSLK